MEANLSNLIVEKGLALGQEVVATEKGIRIGRAKSNDLVLDEPLVSRHHCRVFFKAGRLYLADLGSANGTEVNGQPAQAYNLRIGDRISIGNSIIKVISDTLPDSGMATPVRPAEMVTQRIEDAVGLPVAERFPQQPTATADQKRHVSNGSDMPCACLPVFHQCGDRRRVNRQQS